MGVLAIVARKFGIKLHTAHDNLHAKINQLDLKLSASVNGNPVSDPRQTHPSPSGSVDEEQPAAALPD